jgi:hypothetical protein
MENITNMYVMQSRVFAPDAVPYRLIITPFGTNFLRQELGFREASWNQENLDYVFQDAALEYNEIMVPITWLGFNDRRIVIQVQGNSDAAHAAYSAVSLALAKLASEFQYATPVLFNEETSCTAKLNFEWTALLNPALVDQVSKKLSELSAADDVRAITKDVTVRFAIGAAATDSNLSGYGITRFDQTIAIEPKTGAPLSERLYFTYSPLDSDSHLRFVAGIETRLSEKVGRSKRNPS